MTLPLLERLNRSAEEIDNRLGPIPGSSSDRVARELREAGGTLSRQAELLEAARDALEPIHRTAQLFDKVVIGPAYDNPAEKIWDDGQMYLTVGECTTASTTYDAIREELKGDANGE